LFSHPLFKTILHWLHRLILPLVIAGIVLSTLHQSSLGSLFLIMPHRVHPLWYSPWIPYMFFTSAIAAGMMALIAESFFVERWFGREVDFDLLNRIGKGVIIPLALYLGLRLSDQIIRGVLPGALDGSWQSTLYLSEILLCGIFPIILLSIKKIRETREGLSTCAVLVILGIMSQRMSLSMFTMFRAESTNYVPALGEMLISFAIPAAAALLYLFFAENLQIFTARSQEVALEQDFPTPAPAPFFEHHDTLRSVVAHRSGIAVFVFALAIPALSLRSITPAVPVSAATGWENMYIDGNQAGYVAEFPHQEHQLRLADPGIGESDCQVCHHLDRPNDEASACWECHTDYHQSASIFDHVLHQNALGGNQSCQECHTREHTSLSAEICQDCHENMAHTGGQTTFNMLAVSYKDAMHGRCLNCHQQEAVAQDVPELALCSTCHMVYQEESDQVEVSLSAN
jgi:hypothetical protein